jgi:Na+-transporting NADH:ubiquinone oxidoreductase subunit NqrF
MARKNPKAAKTELFLLPIEKYQKAEFNGFEAVMTRSNSGYSLNKEFATSNYKLDCAFCGARNTVFIWSICGGGKRCTNCRAYISAGGGFDYAVTQKTL